MKPINEEEEEGTCTFGYGSFQPSYFTSHFSPFSPYSCIFCFFVLRTYANETMYIVWVFVQNNCKPLSSHGRRIQKEINENGLLHWFKTQISVRFDSFEPTHGFQLYSCAF
jgi:hypothetical protein